MRLAATPAGAMGSPAIEAVRHLDEERARIYADLVLISLRGAARAVLEAQMADGKYEYQSDFARRYLRQGLEQGLEQGQALGVASSVLMVLEARGVPVSDEVRARVQACSDAATLGRWLARAAIAHTAGELFEQ